MAVVADLMLKFVMCHVIFNNVHNSGIPAKAGVHRLTHLVVWFAEIKEKQIQCNVLKYLKHICLYTVMDILPYSHSVT